VGPGAGAREVAGDRADGVGRADVEVGGVEGGGVGDDDVPRARDGDAASVLHHRVPLDAAELSGGVNSGAVGGVVAVRDAMAARAQPVLASAAAVHHVVLDAAVGDHSGAGDDDP